MEREKPIRRGLLDPITMKNFKPWDKEARLEVLCSIAGNIANKPIDYNATRRELIEKGLVHERKSETTKREFLYIESPQKVIEEIAQKEVIELLEDFRAYTFKNTGTSIVYAVFWHNGLARLGCFPAFFFNKKNISLMERLGAYPTIVKSYKALNHVAEVKESY